MRKALFVMCFTLFLLSSLPSTALALDDPVIFRGNQASFNTRYHAHIREGDIFLREKGPKSENPWFKLDLPEGLAGQVSELAMDDEHIIALNAERQIYTMWNGLDDVDEFKWQMEWGILWWMGPGMKLRSDLIKWDFSVVSPREDDNWTDPAGNKHKIGSAKCSHIWMLAEDGQDLIYNDPWLPLDYSYGICGPYRGAFISENISTSGSHLFLINKYGDMYTRFYDFDIGGADVALPASYEDQRGKLMPKIQIPSKWIRHPKILTLGKITDRISIHKIGKDCINRTMRVEGTNAFGHTGYYEKDITEVGNPLAWTFVRTDNPLMGTKLTNFPWDMSHETLGPRNDRPYARNMENLETLSSDMAWYTPMGKKLWAAQLTNFSAYNTPVEFLVHLSPGDTLALKLHTRETIRLFPSPRGISDQVRKIPGCIEVPQEILDSFDTLSPKAKRFLKNYLMKRRFTEVNLKATLSEVKLSGNAGGLLMDWTFPYDPGS